MLRLFGGLAQFGQRGNFADMRIRMQSPQLQGGRLAV